MVRALEHLRWTAAYVKRNQVAEFVREAALAGELGALLEEKLWVPIPRA